MKTKRKLLTVLALTLVFAAAFVLNFAAMPVYAATSISITSTPSSGSTVPIGTAYTISGSLNGLQHGYDNITGNIVTPIDGVLTISGLAS
ncbi:MAG: hypothetical protein FWE86_03235, partial [Oscillospiraceae bacterium]|nr:hypothetical protein [Oscillospiraceae bacterium]